MTDAAPAEAVPDDHVPRRAFECDGVAWLAWRSGASAYGTGVQAPAAIEAIHFAHASTPLLPLYEALLPAGRFWGLFEEELAGLLRGAVKVVDPGAGPVRPVSRRGAGLL